MRNYEIKFKEYSGVIFGSGIQKTETEKGKSVPDAEKSFLKRKRSTGKIVIIGMTEHIPLKEKRQQQGVLNHGKSQTTFTIPSS